MFIVSSAAGLVHTTEAHDELLLLSREAQARANHLETHESSHHE